MEDEKKLIITAAMMASVFMSLTACSTAPESTAASAAETKGRIILSTTTSTQDSGLLEYLLPVFTEETGREVDVIAVGTGAAIKMGPHTRGVILESAACPA